MRALIRSLLSIPFRLAPIRPVEDMTAQFGESVFKMRELIGAKGQAGWDAAWKAGVTPWDSSDGNVRAPLKELIEVKKFPIPRTGRAIVPGCGRGYDAAYFARLGLESWGVDISETAVEAAKEHIAKTSNPPSNVHFKTLDFFDFPLPDDGKKFVLAYDYTFLCALPPTLREAWGKRYADIIEKDGLLITLIFPIDGDREGGPPYSVSPELYETLLYDRFERVYLEAPAPSDGRTEGREMMGVWKRK